MWYFGERRVAEHQCAGSVSYTKRTCTCGSLRLSNVGQDVKLCGWLQYRRFNNILVLRDWNGITQVVVPDDKDMSTGEIEVELNDFSILNTSMADPPIVGAKEFVVPSRQKGMFYSLPQSPQQFKQLLMVGGLDRYFQVARCYRDEGTKPERQPEFTQLDIEMSFVDREGVIKLIEDLLVYSWPEDSPPIEDVTDAIKNCGNEVLLSRLQNTDSCATLIRIKGFKTLVYVIRDENREGEKGGGNSLLVKMLNIAEDETVVMAVGFQVRPKDAFNFLWVVDFPLFLPKEDGTGLEAAHHPFTDARPQDRELLFTEPHKVIGQHYDLVLNGSEIGGGSIRICDPAIQRYVIENILKEDSSELEHLLFALGTGCPPHGGIALGLDRLFAILCGTPSIRDVIAFPKSSAGNDLMSGSPAPVKQAELDFYHIQIKKE
ncbi:SYDM-like protein [Mya arenaria]|uniref:SYDM-like protein n=1 Tax=Mya arenaria TaxID=6604 RepID=A0ABY7DZM0_MYAAR|nr:SYDM-like protein [Mya arenaria]